jgi:hypothetical protein
MSVSTLLTKLHGGKNPRSTFWFFGGGNALLLSQLIIEQPTLFNYWNRYLQYIQVEKSELDQHFQRTTYTDQKKKNLVKFMVPPGFIPPQQPNTTDIYPPPPPAPTRYAYSPRDPWYGSSESSSSFQTPSTTWPKTQTVLLWGLRPLQPGRPPSSTCHDYPMETPSFPFGVTTASRPRSPVAEAKPEAPSQQDLFKAFLEFMNNKKQWMWSWT